nr:serine/arginine-rich splicing factor SR45-like [Aegilops tauschii subsp. strangulata]
MLHRCLASSSSSSRSGIAPELVDARRPRPPASLMLVAPSPSAPRTNKRSPVRAMDPCLVGSKVDPSVPAVSRDPDPPPPAVSCLCLALCSPEPHLQDPHHRRSRPAPRRRRRPNHQAVPWPLPFLSVSPRCLSFLNSVALCVCSQEHAPHGRAPVPTFPRQIQRSTSPRRPCRQVRPRSSPPASSASSRRTSARPRALTASRDRDPQAGLFTRQPSQIQPNFR